MSEEQKAGGGEWSALRELVAKWRKQAKVCTGLNAEISAEAIAECADELEKALAAAPSEPPSEVGESQDFNAKFGGDIFVVTGEHQRTAFFSKAAAERYLTKQDPERFKIVVYAKPCEHWKASAASDGSTEEDAGPQPEVCQSSSVEKRWFCEKCGQVVGKEVGEGLRELATYLLNTSVPDWEYDKVLTMAAESLAALAAPAPKPVPPAEREK